jgi:hypothetical protein
LGILLPVFLAVMMPAAAPVSTPPKAPPSTPAPRPSAPVTQTIVGQILSVDAAAATLGVGESVQASPTKKGDRDTVSLKVDRGTQLLRGKRATTVAELRPRDHVVVRYVLTPDGARALSIRAADQSRETPTVVPQAAGGTPGAPG